MRRKRQTYYRALISYLKPLVGVRCIDFQKLRSLKDIKMYNYIIVTSTVDSEAALFI